ncbi:unnamed protein product [Parnassius apollo]|uniref:(apollo) hypothetical protein n=1 Tax=Parnassius apollo TaxID=110799 RepID=A0A8S3WTM3_PARAO|nr:unnamed protein product [Parnassius apollo]
MQPGEEGDAEQELVEDAEQGSEEDVVQEIEEIDVVIGRLGTRRGQENEDEESGVNEDCPNSGTWSVKEFNPRFPQMIQPAYLVKDTEGFTKTDYLKQYIDDELIDLIQRKSNQTAIEKSGRSLFLTSEELYIYLGITLIMAAVNYPKLRMYGEKIGG